MLLMFRMITAVLIMFTLAYALGYGVVGWMFELFP
jgi:hypothetical protein